MVESKHPQIDAQAAEKDRQEKKHPLAYSPAMGHSRILVDDHHHEGDEVDHDQADNYIRD